MTNWGWYWKIKLKHQPKKLCSFLSLHPINSFDMFKKHQIEGVLQSKDRCSLFIPEYKLRAYLQADLSLKVVYEGGSYQIPVEKKTCNYGGHYYFFQCPQCNKRMRILYCLEGKYLCRKCAHLGYHSQRFYPSKRCSYNCYKILSFLQDRGGSLEQKPPCITSYKFQKYKVKYLRCDEQNQGELNKELRMWYGPRAERYIENCYVPSSALMDVWDIHRT